MESLYLLFLVAIILVFVFPLTIDGKISYDAIENHGAIAIKLLCFKFLVAKLKREKTKIILITQKENKDVKIEFGEKQLRFLIFFQREVGNKIKVRKLNVYSVVGAGNPFASALVSSAFSNGVQIVLARLKSIQKTGSFCLKNKTDFFENKFAFAAATRITLSIFDVVFSGIVSILRNKNDSKVDSRLRKI